MTWKTFCQTTEEGGEENSDLDDSDDDDENPADVVFGGMPLRTTSGRTVIRPKASGPLVHFSQTSCKRMPYR